MSGLRWSSLRTRIAVGVAAAVAVGGIAWAGVALAAPSDPTASSASASPSPSASHPLSAGGLQDPAAPAAAPASDAVPVRVAIPSIGVDSGLEDLHLDDTGRLVAPADYASAGWFTAGVVPGSIGPAVIAGHIDSPTAPAVFANLDRLTDGDQVQVTLSDGRVLTFAVTAKAQSAKADFPTSEVYANVPDAQLRLITCAGTFDRGIGHYTDNLIVFARLIG